MRYLSLIIEFSHLFIISCRLTGSDKEIQLKCARAWTAWELNILTLTCDSAVVKEGSPLMNGY